MAKPMPPSITTKQRQTSPITNPIAVRVLTPIGQDTERALVALWARDWRDSRKEHVTGAADIGGIQSRKVVLASLPTARRMLQEHPESFETKVLQLTPRDFESLSFYSRDPLDISAILLASFLCWDGPKWQSLGDAEARQREQAETASRVEAELFDDDNNDLDDEFRPITREYHFEGRRPRRIAVVIGGVWYSSATQAAQALGTGNAIIRERIERKVPGYFRAHDPAAVVASRYDQKPA